jgi:hypothetical protein
VAVKVTATNTGLVHETITNESGTYRVEPLPPGPYQVEANLSGFKAEVRTIALNIEPARIDFTLVVGSVSEVVNVEGQAPILQTDDSSLGQLVDERKIVDLPLNGRDFSQLTYIVPGAYAPRPNSNLGYRGGFSLQGELENTNQYLLEGLAVNSPGIFEVAIHTNLDAIGEFKVQTSGYEAEYGRFAGGQVDSILKSGTNNFHGSAFGFFRNSAVGQARNFFDPYPRTYNAGFRRGQYGAVLGGPIIKNKSFFFFGYQGQRLQAAPPQAITVPLPDFFSGDLSKLSGTIKDPTTGQPFGGNIIPQNRLSPIALGFQQFWPLPTISGLTNNATTLLVQPDNFNQESIKLDHELTSRQHASLSYTLNNEQFVESESNPSLSLFETQGSVKAWTLSLGHVFTVSPTVINELRIGGSDYQRGHYTTDLDRSKNWDAILGISGVQANPAPGGPPSAPDSTAFGVPYVTVTGYAELGNPYSNPQPRKELAFTTRDIFSIDRGKHSMKFGVDWLAYQVNQIHEFNARGSFSFTGGITGNAMADFLLGLPAVTQRAPVFDSNMRYARKKSLDFFAQDAWRVTSTLTLNYGIRLEENFAAHEKFGHISSYDPATGGLRIPLDLNKITDPRDQQAITAYRALYPGLPMTTGPWVNDNLNNVAPRFGFAYSPSGASNMVIRGGYGIFYQIQALSSVLNLDSAPFVLTQRFTNADNVTFANPWGNGIGSNTIAVGETIDQNEKDPYYQDWNLDVQRQLPRGFLLDVTYQGKKGTDLIRSHDINQPLNLITGIRPIANFSSISYSESSGRSIYHGLQVRSERRSATGLTYLFSFAWSKLIDDLATPEDATNQRAARGLAVDNDKFRTTLSLVYQLPVGHDKKFMTHAPSGVDALLGGWELSGISRANSGYNFTPHISTNNSGTGDNNDRPNQICNPGLDSSATVKAFWNRNCFAMPAPHTFGNAATGSLVGPGFTAQDFTLMKILKPRESQQVQVRLELYNAFNHANFNDPSTTWNAATFGTIGSTVATQGSSIGDAREFQFALKWIF